MFPLTNPSSQQAQLWADLQTFAFDNPRAELPFSRRLESENGWSEEHARRVVEEYRRFLFLAREAGHPVSPSEDVDQVWHLHLIYSRSYWENLCGKVLGVPFHHEPTLGGEEEAAKHRNWYARTLASYRKFFGEAPPRDIWPAPKERLATIERVRVDARRVWVIPRPRLSFWPGTLLLAILVLPATGCGREVFLHMGGPWDLTGPQFLLLYSALFFGVWLFALSVRYLGRGPGVRSWSADELPDPYEIAYLAGYRSRVLDAALASLVQRGHLRFCSIFSKQISYGTPLPPGAHGLDKAMVAYVIDRGRVSYADLVYAGSLKEPLQTLDDRLVSHGCLVPASRGLLLRVVTASLFLLLLGFGLSKVQVGLARGKPVGFLIAYCIITAIVSVAFLFWRTRRTRRGQGLLRHLQGEHSEWKRTKIASETPARKVELAVALFGFGILWGSSLHQLPSRYMFFNSGASGNGSSGSGGSSCSGGGGGGGGCGGGGGGGGCGGCGGGG